MKALLLIDMQRDFCTGGSLAIDGSLGIIEPINAFVPRCVAAGIPVVATKDYHPRGHVSFASSHQGKMIMDSVMTPEGVKQILWPDHCVQGTPGCEFYPALDTVDIDHVVYKGTHKEVDSYSAFFDNARLYKTELDDWLKKRGIDELLICGLALDYCVRYSATDARELGYEVQVLMPLTAVIAPKSGAEALAALQASGCVIRDDLDGVI